jgi:hypothetical protein
MERNISITQEMKVKSVLEKMQLKKKTIMGHWQVRVQYPNQARGTTTSALLSGRIPARSLKNPESAADSTS